MEEETEYVNGIEVLAGLCDEHGLQHWDSEAMACDTHIFVDKAGNPHECWEAPSGMVNVVISMTPEQAVELGRDNSDVVQRLIELRGGHYGWPRLYRAVTGDFLSPHTSCSENEAKFIEKLLTCMVGVGRAETCHNADIGAEGYFKCSECGASCSVDWERSGWGEPNFCPNCGKAVTS